MKVVIIRFGFVPCTFLVLGDDLIDTTAKKGEVRIGLITDTASHGTWRIINETYLPDEVLECLYAFLSLGRFRLDIIHESLYHALYEHLSVVSGELKLRSRLKWVLYNGI